MTFSPQSEYIAPPERRDVTALLVIDMFSPMDGGDGRALRRTAPKVVPVIGELIKRARAVGVPVVFVENHQGRWTATADELVDAAKKHGLGDELDPILPLPGDPFVTRSRPSAFDRSQLEDLLQSRGVRRVILSGQATEQGILYSALDASVSRFQVVVPQDAVAAIDPSLAGAALRMMDRNMHADVTTAAAIDLTVTKVQQPVERVRTPRPVRLPVQSVDGSPAAPVSETRQQLLTALAIVISREGFSGAKVADIAREARTSLRTFYAEFSSKEECFLELHRQITTAVIQSVSAAVVFDRPWVEVMRKGFETYFSILMAQPLLTHAILVELATLSPEARAAREEAMDMFAAMLCDMVEQGRAANPELESRALSPMIARGIMGAFMELVVSHVDRGETDRFPELIDTTTDMLTSVVLVNVAADPATAAAQANAAIQPRV